MRGNAAAAWARCLFVVALKSAIGCAGAGKNTQHAPAGPTRLELGARAPAPAGADRAFMQVDGRRFVLNGKSQRFVGVNFWYGAYLAASEGLGNIERLRAELDLLASLGVTNLRVLGASESGPMKRAIKPAFRGPGSEYNETLLRGLDVLLSEMGKRDLKAVIYLNNFWEWSGGMGTYLFWVNGGKFVDLGDPKQPWPAYPLFTMRFYEDARANALYRDYVKAVVTRTNHVTRVPYKDDPTIMAWQLANEPRPGHNADAGNHVLPAFYRWVDETAGFIKSLDAEHLVSSGNEGSAGCADLDSCFIEAHQSQYIDYLTFHLWPKNWGWLDDRDMPGSIARTFDNAADYIDKHIEYAEKLGKPLVLEEFGLPRDAGALKPGTPTQYRDRFYAFVFERIEQSSSVGGPLVGSNVWSWGGFGRAAHADFDWRDGDTSYTGDPPQEPQGLNSIFDADVSTLALVREHANALR